MIQNSMHNVILAKFDANLHNSYAILCFFFKEYINYNVHTSLQIERNICLKFWFRDFTKILLFKISNPRFQRILNPSSKNLKNLSPSISNKNRRNVENPKKNHFLMESKKIIFQSFKIVSD